jgi:hypothetical protein
MNNENFPAYLAFGKLNQQSIRQEGNQRKADYELLGNKVMEVGDSGDIDHLIPEQIDQVIVWRKTEQISWRSF